MKDHRSENTSKRDYYNEKENSDFIIYKAAELLDVINELNN